MRCQAKTCEEPGEFGLVLGGVRSFAILCEYHYGEADALVQAVADWKDEHL